MTEQTKHKPDPMKAVGHLDGVMWDLAMMIKFGDQPQGDTVGRATRHLRAALEALEGPAK
jgi:hypothetical protein